MAMWYLNGKTNNGTYKIFAFDDDGLPASINPVIHNIAGVSDIVWPSAFKQNGTTHVFASCQVNGKWTNIRRFTAPDELTFIDAGVAVAALPSEPAGIGPAAILHDATLAEPFVMYFTVRGTPFLNVACATAANIQGPWTRRGIVYTGSGTDEAGGVSVSYAFKEGNEYILGIHCYDAALNIANSKIVRSTNALGTFGNKAILMQPDGFISTFQGGIRGNWGIVPAGVTFPIGIPMVCRSGANQQVNVIEKQKGNVIWFKYPFLADYTQNATVTSFARLKADISHIEKLPDGTWTGFVTGYGSQLIMCEYVARVASPTLTGNWQYVRDGLMFPVFYDGTVGSMENPTRCIEI